MNRPELKSVSVVLWGIVGLVIISIVVLKVAKKGKKELIPNGEKAARVVVIDLQARSMADTIKLPGKVRAKDDSIVAAEKGGKVDAILVKKGQIVKKGQAIIRIDDRMWKNNLARAELVERDARKEHERWDQLRSSGSVSDTSFERVRQAFELAKVGLKQAQTDVAQCEVSSPFDGVVNGRFVEVGEYVHDGTPVVHVVNTGIARLMVEVPERDVVKMRPGMAVPFSVPTYRGETFTGEVVFVAQAMPRGGNTYRVDVEVDNAGGKLRGGMIADAILDRGKRENVCLLPLSAVLPHKGEHIVFLAVGDRAERRAVGIEAYLAEEVVIGKGLKFGERVVVEGNRSLHDGMLLDVEVQD